MRQRTVAAADFWPSYRRTALAPDELLLRIRIPVAGGREVRYRKLGTRRAQAISKVVMALAWTETPALSGWRDVRVALGSVAATPIRAIATGAVGLQAGALPGRGECDEATIRATACKGATVEQRGRFWLIGDDKRVQVLDRYGDEVVAVEGVRTDGTQVGAVFEAHIKYRGPITLRPTVWIIEGRRLVELGSFDAAATRLHVAPGECIVIEDSDVGVAAARAFGGRVLRWLG